MSRELLYVYTENLNDCFVNQGINFSQNFEVEFDITEGKLKITKIENQISNLLWGENITSINLLVGKNGSGKSTILNLLGFDKMNRNDLLSNSKSNKWFALYFLRDDYYIIEGNDKKIIKNLDVIEEYRTDYAYVVKLENGRLNYIDYIQLYDNEVSKLLYLYDSERIGEFWYYSGNRIISDGFDNQLGYQRQYMIDPLMTDLFDTLNNAEYKLDGSFSAKNVKVRIIRRNQNLDHSEIGRMSAAINLYDSDQKNILLLNPEIRLPFIKKENVKKWSTKERFIIEFLEEAIFYRMKDIQDDVFEEIVKEIKILEFKLINDDFDYRIEYLNQILKILYADKTGYFYNIEKKFNGYSKIINLLKAVEDKYFLKDDLIKFNFFEYSKNNEILELFQFYDETEIEQVREVYPLKVEFTNLSSGELQFIKHFSNINKAINIASNNIHIENIIILLDEPDRTFHPEWSRKYIYTLVNLLNNISFNKSFKFQVILTTHSPFMISDIPKQYITCIDVVEDKDKLKRVVSQAEFGLMSNFYDLIKNNFFMTYPIGDFARKIFNDLKSDIDELNKKPNKLKSINMRISLIDDPLIKAKLKSYLTQKLKEINSSDYDSLMMKKQELEEEQREIEKRLNIIRMEQNND